MLPLYVFSRDPLTEVNILISEWPDPLLMNAFNTINLAGAAILTSVAYAEELGIPKTKWIYALGGAGTQDSDNCEHIFPQAFWSFKVSEYLTTLSKVWLRPNYHSSPSIERSIDAGLRVSGLTKEDIDLYDFYS